MSDTFARPRRQHAASWLTGILLVAALIGAAITINTAAPSSWWPQTGQAFAAAPTSPQTSPQRDAAREERCALILGPAHDYCLKAAKTTGMAAEQASGTGTAMWPAAFLTAAIGLLAVLRRRSIR
ncbi:hypothetical protein [Streptomyces sp. NPDC050600]|uniref:hypothetical protein n=1 Tax=Streptomyces sp. NPDC050600 TaxID=3157213 RepID=UPI0034338271